MLGWKWKATNHWVQPTSSREVMSMIGSIGVYSTGQRFAWRGMGSADFELSSSLHRAVGGDEATVRAAELEILSEAREWGLGTHPTGRVDDLQLLSDLQHFAIPTRLIDMTSNPMTALWFACQAAPEGLGKAGLLLALNVTDWPRLTTVPGAGGMTYSRIDDPEGAQLHDQLETDAPFVVESASPNARLRAQEGFFVAGRVPVPLPVPSSHLVTAADESSTIDLSSGVQVIEPTPFRSLRVRWPDDLNQGDLSRRLLNPDVGRPRHLPFVAIIISANLKDKLLRYLEGTYNRSARVLFPDYQGYAAFGRHVNAPVQAM
ncbi:hypothetical protein GCM10027058_27750 [Microbacterium neimengense]